MSCFIDAVEVYTPGIRDWATLREIFEGNLTFDSGVTDDKYAPESLPRNERRRASSVTRLAFRITESIASQTSLDLSKTCSVFASGGGDYEVVHEICSSLATTEKHISPTQFHNSVHNAAGGYGGIPV